MWAERFCREGTMRECSEALPLQHLDRLESKRASNVANKGGHYSPLTHIQSEVRSSVSMAFLAFSYFSAHKSGRLNHR